MKVLKELIEILTEHPTACFHFQKNAKPNQLFRLLKEQSIEDEVHVKLMLYPNANHTGFTKTKHQLKWKLLYQILLIDPPANVPIDQAFYKAYRNFLIARFLLRCGGRRTAIGLIQKVYLLSNKYHFTDLQVASLRLLRYHYSVILGNRKKGIELHKALSETLVRYQFEIEADGFVEELLSHYVKNRSTKKHLHQRALEMEVSVKRFLERTESLHLKHRLFFIQVAKFMCINDYAGTIKTCHQATNFFQNHNETPKSILRTYQYQLVVSYIQLRQYAQARVVLSELMLLMQDGMSNWFKALEIQCKLELHAKSYFTAYEVWQKAVQHSKFRKLYPQAKEKWKVFEAYFFFLTKAKIIAPNWKSNKFRLGRFLNEVPTFSRDKRGLNIPILIIQILFLIYQNKQDAVLDRIEVLERYSSRYLKNDENFRSNCFIKMLLKIPKSHFHVIATKRNTETLFSRLQKVPLEMASEAHEIEIIPYEDLWQLVLNGLKK